LINNHKKGWVDPEEADVGQAEARIYLLHESGRIDEIDGRRV